MWRDSRASISPQRSNVKVEGYRSLVTSEYQRGRKIEEYRLCADPREVPSQEFAFLESPELPVAKIRERSERCHVLELHHDTGRSQASFRLPDNPRTVLRSHSSESKRGDHDINRPCVVEGELIEQFGSIDV